MYKKNNFKKSFLILALLLLSTFNLSAQSIITGKISDINGEPLSGVTIYYKLNGSISNATSNLDGGYRLQTKQSLSENESIIYFEMIGFKDKSVTYSGQQTINVVLEEDNLVLDEIVVTALGIKREEKRLGYATQTVKGDDIIKSNPANWSSSLTGKVAGASISSAGGLSTQISLRGNVSLNHTGNGALVILDGVPLSSPLTNSGAAYGAGGDAGLPIDYGNGFSDINPNDIESIQILKGASATALYGTRAANGVVLITSKSGKESKKGIGVTFSSNMSMDNVMHWPDFQYEFGQGLPSYVGKAGSIYEGVNYYSYGADPNGTYSSTSGTSSAYGPRFNSEVNYYQFDPVTQKRATEATPWIAYPDNRKDFYRTGYNLTNTVAFTNNYEKGAVRASISYTNNEMMLPNSGYDRISASVSANHKVSNAIELNLKTSYYNRSTDNLPALGYNSNSIAYFLIFQNPNVNLEWLEPMWFYGEEGLRQLQPYSSYIGNPYLILNEAENPSDKHSNVSMLSAKVNINDHWNFMMRSGFQLTIDNREQHRPISDKVYSQGYFRKQNIFDYEVNSDFLLTYENHWDFGLDFTGSVGGNIMYQNYDALSASVTGLINPGVYNLANGISNPYTVNTISKKAVNSLYFTLNWGYKDKLFVDITGRNDWSSTLPSQNRSFFYPSIGVSALIDQMVTLPKFITMLKARASFAQVGNDTQPYNTSPYLGSTEFPGSTVLDKTLYNADFKPEMSTNYEAGLDLRMFDGRVSLDLSYYYNETKNQILQAPMDPTIGYTSAIINSGNVRNSGVEIYANITAIEKKDFRWDVGFTWSKNDNKILSLAEGVDENQLITSLGSASIIGSVGGSIGDIWGYKFDRSEDGEIIIGSNGLPVVKSEMEFVANAYPAWKGGFMTSLSYKGLRLDIQLDGQMGGNIYSHTHHKMTEQGKLSHTLNGRLPGTDYYISVDDPRIAEQGLTPLEGVYMVAPGVVDNGDGTYSPNTKLVTVEAYNKQYYRMNNVEANTFDASFLKLREVTLSYSLPSRLTNKIGFLTGASIGVYGRNLFCWTDFPIYDPELSTLSGNSLTTGLEIGTLPSARTFGVNLNLSF